jgi:hypothetical protein
MASYTVTAGNVGQVFYKIEGHLKKILDSVETEVDKHGAIRVGIHPDAQDYAGREKGEDLPSGAATSVAFVAALHEFGTSRFPARPWLSNSIKADRAFYDEKIQEAAKDAALNPSKIGGAMAALGEISVRKIQNHIEANDIGLKANKESTARRKGGNTPLIDTGHLVRSIDWKWRDGSK